jgi:hypothetical protein
MGNAFMPSVFSSMNRASRGTLQDIVQQRLMQDEMAQQQAALMQKAMAQRFSMDMRLRGDQRAGDKLTFDQQQATAAASEKKAAAEAKLRQERNVAGAQDIFATGVQNGAAPEDLVRAALDGKVPVSMMPKPPVVKEPKKTLQEIEDEAAARARGNEKGKGPKATKVKAKAPIKVKGKSNARAFGGSSLDAAIDAAITQAMSAR